MSTLDPRLWTVDWRYHLKIGVFLPISGRAASAATLQEVARKAEDWGYDSLWAADRIIIPWEIKTPYPYSGDEHFIVPPDRPFLDSLTCLAFLAACTTKIALGVSVLVLPYRNPLHWAKIATTIDHLSQGRFILGVGVGWMAEEFRALGAPFSERGKVSDEQLGLLEEIWRKEHSTFSGSFYRFDDIAFFPKPYRPEGLPVWVGGEGLRAQKRAATYGDAWFPYFVRITPEELSRKFRNVQQLAGRARRSPDSVTLACCLPVEVCSEPVPQEPDRLSGTPSQLAEAVSRYAESGVRHLALQFMVPRWPDRLDQMQRFAEEVLPAIRA